MANRLTHSLSLLSLTVAIQAILKLSLQLGLELSLLSDVVVTSFSACEQREEGGGRREGCKQRKSRCRERDLLKQLAFFPAGSQQGRSQMAIM